MHETIVKWDTAERLDLVRNGKWHWLLDGFSSDYLTLAERNWYEDRFGLHPKEIQYRLERKLIRQNQMTQNTGNLYISVTEESHLMFLDE